MVLGDGRQSELWVCFNPAYHLDRVSRVEDQVTVMHFHFHPVLYYSFILGQIIVQ